MKKDKKYIEKIVTAPNINCDFKHFNGPILVHWHDKYELEFFDSGSGVAKINNTEFEVKKGVGYLVIPPDTHAFTPIIPHYTHTPAIPPEAYNLSFPQHIIENKDLKIFF